MGILKLQLFQQVQAALAEFKGELKKNWLKMIGLGFLFQASMEYVANHAFGCFTVAALLLGYASYNRSQEHKKTELAHNEELEFSLFFEFVVVTFFCCLMVVSAFASMPLSLQTWLHLPPFQPFTLGG